MAFLHCELFSDALGMATAVNVILPDKGALGDAATVLLLHGLSDNCTGWTRYTSVERYARERGLAAIFGSKKAVPPKDDLFVLAERLSGNAPGLYLSCGEQDKLFASTCRFDEHLSSLGIAHRFEHWPGIHSWDFWDESLQKSLTYFFG